MISKEYSYTPGGNILYPVCGADAIRLVDAPDDCSFPKLLDRTVVHDRRFCRVFCWRAVNTGLGFFLDPSITLLKASDSAGSILSDDVVGP